MGDEPPHDGVTDLSERGDAAAAAHPAPEHESGREASLAEQEPKPEASFLRELPILILIAFGLALLLKTFIVQAFFIPSGSMEPTLQVDDRVLVNKLVYRFRDPARGEIIVFAAERAEEPRSFLAKVRAFLTEGFGVVNTQEKDFIKRVIGLPGETVRVNNKGRVFITPADGGPSFRLDEPYLNEERDLEAFGPKVVPEGSYFVMGDNRAHSSDSRVPSVGPVSRQDIIGKAFMRIWPPRRVGFFKRPAYAPEEGPQAARAGPGLALGLSFAAWSPTVTSSRGCARPASGWWPGSTRRVAGRWPGRWSRAR